MYPSYLEAYNTGSLQEITNKAWEVLGSCSICPRQCKVNRLNNQKGFCGIGLRPMIYSFIPHHGEEPPISGTAGSGTIFFSGCNLHCLYCQNYEFSQLKQGREVEPEELALIMLKIQEEGVHNLNFVTPTHILPQILKALLLAIPKGLKIPLIYNTSGYELVSMIKMLEGIIDIYLPDMRYADSELAKNYSDALDYPKYNQTAVKEMQRQVGSAQFDASGIITRGLIIRHLVLPENISGTENIMRFIKEEISQDTYISLMSQYLPYYRASEFKEISRRLKNQEYQEAKDILQKYGLTNGWVQDSFGQERFAGVNIKQSLL
ncbi:MAG: radical SAM protein [Candidatus Omnitrophota bacterium]